LPSPHSNWILSHFSEKERISEFFIAPIADPKNSSISGFLLLSPLMEREEKFSKISQNSRDPHPQKNCTARVLVVYTVRERGSMCIPPFLLFLQCTLEDEIGRRRNAGIFLRTQRISPDTADPYK